jgi:NAD(P)-dependent dehydrogenase (short-subunit alcohol dehydrogenase family)
VGSRRDESWGRRRANFVVHRYGDRMTGPEPWSLVGRVALVTGASSGIGRGCALALAGAGAAVLCAARSVEPLERVADEIRDAGGIAAVHAGDLTREDEVVAAVAAAEPLGDLRILVTAAGTNRPGPSRDYALADWDALFDLNVRATFLACRTVADRLLARGAHGSLITLSSQMGAVGYPGRAAYCATKHAVEGLTKALAVEWAPHGVRVNAVAPTFVETPMTAAALADPTFRTEVEQRLPQRRLATIDDVGHAVRYLASDASAAVTGHALRVDGGWTAW